MGGLASQYGEDSVNMNIRQALILAGGKGTRLGSMAANIPKPFLDVGGNPFISFLFKQLKQCGIERIVLSLGYQASVARKILATIDHCGMEVTTVVEPEPLGTCGGVKNCADVLDNFFFVLNGDSYFDFESGLLVRAIMELDCMAALALRPVPDTSRYGSVCCENGYITAFAEKKKSHGPGIINAGFYAFRKQILEMLPEGNSSLERDVFPTLARQSKLAGVYADGFFIDIGMPEDFNHAQMLFAQDCFTITNKE